MYKEIRHNKRLHTENLAYGQFSGEPSRCPRFAGTSPRMSNAFITIQYQGKSDHAGHQMDRGRRRRRATHPGRCPYIYQYYLTISFHSYIVKG